MKKLCFLAAAMVAVGAQAEIIDSSFTNLDFDSGNAMTSNFTGFDTSTDIAGWMNQGDAASLADSGVESTNAWWGSYDLKSAFMKAGDGTYNLSTYTIQSGDVYSLTFYAKAWSLAAKGWGSDADGELQVSLFYGDESNIIDTFSTGTITDHSNSSDDYVLYQTTISATEASVGQTLGVLVVNTGSNHMNFDEVSISVIPEPATFGLLSIAGLGMFFARRRMRK